MWKVYFKSLGLLFLLGFFGSLLVRAFELPQDAQHFVAIITGLVVYGSYMAPEIQGVQRQREEDEKKRRLNDLE